MITVLTQNIWGAGPLWSRRRRRLARKLASLAPDIAGLQEVHSPAADGPSSQAHELADLAGGYHAVFAPGRIARSGRCEGVAILCRHPVVEHSMRALTLDRGDLLDRIGPRVVLRAVVDSPEGLLEVFVTHLSLSRRARARTVPELLAFTSADGSRSAHLRSVLMGDLNAGPEDPSIAALRRAGWVDAWSAAGAATRRAGGTYPSFAPWRRIDRILVRPAETWAVRDCRREAVWGCDHLGVVARLDWRGRLSV